jgi:hypothetical protein
MKRLAAIVGLLCLVAVPCAAQDALRPDRLPANTTFYFHWQGTAAGREANTLIRLWNDPEFVPARDELLGEVFSELLKAGITRQELETLFTSTVLAGALRFPPAVGEKDSARGEFLIVHAADRKELIRKLLEQPPAEGEEKPVVTRESIGSQDAEKVATSKAAHYRLFLGDYFLRAGSPTALEALIKWLQTAEAPAESLAQVPAYQRAREFRLPGAAMDYFFHLAGETLPVIPPVSGFNLSALLKALRLERIHSMSGSAALAAEGTRMRFAVLGDTSPGSFFDLAGESRPSFATLRAAPADAAVYNAARVDLRALFSLLRSAIGSAFPPEQSAMVEAVEGAIAAQIGMAIPDALGLLEGEMASISLQGAGDPLGDLYAVTIRDAEKVLYLARSLLGERIGNESREGTTTFLAVSMPYTDPDTGTQRQRFHHAAVTPQMLLVGPSRAALRETVARLSSESPAAADSLAARLQAARPRAGLPENLSGIAYADLTRVDWKQIGEQMRKAEAETAKNNPDAKRPHIDWEKIFSSGVFARYLRTSAGGWWKDSRGIFFDGFVE